MFYPHTIKGKPFPRLDLISAPPTVVKLTALLDGTTQFFTGGDICNFGNADFCYFGWFNLNTGAPNWGTILSRYDDASTSRQTILRYLIAGNVMQFFIAGSSGNSEISISLPSFDEWHFVYCEYNSTALTISISIDNGTPISAAHIEGVRSSTSDLRIGNTGIGTIDFWDGGLGFIGAMPDLLTAGEITSVYNEGEALCYDALPSTVKAKFSTTGEYWHLADFPDHTTDELTGQKNGLNLTNISATPFTGTGLDIECS